jgi:hypothetical protein
MIDVKIILGQRNKMKYVWEITPFLPINQIIKKVPCVLALTILF